MRLSQKLQVVLVILLFFLAGCAPIDIPKSTYKWVPRVIPADGVIDASVRIEAKHEMAPEIADMWRKWLNTEQNLINWNEAVSEAVLDDMRRSGIFTSVNTTINANYDFLVKIQSRESQPQNYILNIDFK